MLLSLNGQEWIDAMSFRYHETVVVRLAYANLDPNASLTADAIN